MLTDVQTIHETRRQRLNLLLKTTTLADLNEALGWPRTDARLSRIKSAVRRGDREGKFFEMGDAIAREIEKALGKPLGYMDTPPTYAEIHGREDPISRAIFAMESMAEAEQYKAVRLLDALTQQPEPMKTETLG